MGRRREAPPAAEGGGVGVGWGGVSCFARGLLAQASWNMDVPCTARVFSLGFKVWGLDFEVWGLSFEVLGLDVLLTHHPTPEVASPATSYGGSCVAPPTTRRARKRTESALLVHPKVCQSERE